MTRFIIDLQHQRSSRFAAAAAEDFDPHPAERIEGRKRRNEKAPVGEGRPALLPRWPNEKA
jgi:hypothetical protein